MSARAMKMFGPDHPITTTPDPDRFVVTVGGRTIADTTAARTLREADDPPIRYVPRRGVDMGALVRPSTTSHCSYKGDVSYFGIPAGGSQALDAAWTYETPHAAVAAIAGHLAFYPDRIDRED